MDSQRSGGGRTPNARDMTALRLGLACVAVLLLGSCATAAPSASRPAEPAPPTSIEAVGLLREGFTLPRGYLDPEALPNSLTLLPPPPAEGSAAEAADTEAFRRALQASPERQALAAEDAKIDWPVMIGPFEGIIGTSLSDGSKPHTEMLLQRSIADGGLSTYRAKNHYNRVRPFEAAGVASCTPEDEESLRGDGSYPSGHTAIGWMLALVLTDLVPEKQDEILERGYDYGESRVVCRVHWLSDTTAGRTIASATFARLQSDPTFRAQLELARNEMARR